MAVIVCRRCEQSVAFFEEQCPHCGLRRADIQIEKTLMFKLTPFISLAGLIVLIVMIIWQ